MSIGDVLHSPDPARLIRVEGIVIDAMPDIPDSRYVRLFLSDGRDILDVAPLREICDRSPEKFVGARIRIAGRVASMSNVWRKFSNPYIGTVTVLEILDSHVENPFPVKPLPESADLNPAAVRELGWRQVTGTVRAVWDERNLLLESANGRRITVRLANGQPRPSVGELFRVSGLCDTDSAHLWLKFATGRTESGSATAEAPAIPLSGADIGSNIVCSPFDDRCVTVRGIVRSIYSDAQSQSRLLLECDGHLLTVNPGCVENAFADIPIGSEIGVTGIFLAEIDPWSLMTPFAQVKGFSIVLRTPADIVILSHPQWWTTRRLLALIVALSLTLALIVAWTVGLKRLVRKRSDELIAEREAHAFSDIRVYERTHLAVELHDSIAQNLTGAAMEIETASKLRGDAPPEMLAHLELAGKTLKSCRDELRNCIWDLRSDALSEPDMTRAIRRTLQPLATKAEIAVRFNVARERFSDNTAHAVLRIIRELVANAVRHGHAKSIRIAGCIENDELVFSVTDDGCGFDPDSCPGILQGHFGLQGIRERIRQIGGTLTLNSSAGSGTKAAIHIKTHGKENQGPDR